MTLTEYRLQVLELFTQYQIQRRDQSTIDALARLFQSLDNPTPKKGTSCSDSLSS